MDTSKLLKYFKFSQKQKLFFFFYSYVSTASVSMFCVEGPVDVGTETMAKNFENSSLYQVYVKLVV